jgi:hypothetical protein
MFTTDGKELIISWLAGDTVNAPDTTNGHIGFGTDNTAATEEDSALGSESLRRIVTTITKSGKRIEFEATVPTTIGNGTTFRELGLFNAASGGTMLQRIAHGDISKTSTFSIKATITVEIE